MVGGMLGGMNPRGVEMVRLGDVAAGDVVLLGRIRLGGADQAMRIESVTEHGTRDGFVLRGPMIDLPSVGRYFFEGVDESEIFTAGFVTRLVPEQQSTAFVDSLIDEWGDALFYQLGGVDNVAPAILMRSGGSQLVDILPPTDKLTAGGPGALDTLPQLPVGGWRELTVAEDSRVRSSPDTKVFATPHPDVSGAWLTLSLSPHWDTDSWICHASGTAGVPVPCKAARRAGLQLSWPPQKPVVVGVSPVLALSITNISDRPWVNVGRDQLSSFAWLRDKQGNRISGSGYPTINSNVTYLPRLAPGQSFTISEVTLLTPNLDSLPRGDYRMEARLNSLELHADNGTLALV